MNFKEKNMASACLYKENCLNNDGMSTECRRCSRYYNYDDKYKPKESKIKYYKDVFMYLDSAVAQSNDILD